MITVSWYHDEQEDRYNARVPDFPKANSTGRSEQEMRDFLVVAYNREADTSLTEEDFEFIQVTPPAPRQDMPLPE